MLHKVTKEQRKANGNEAKQVAIDGGTSRNDNSSLVDIPVTFDCTWSKRGFTASHCAGLACKDKSHHLDAVFKEPLLKIYERLSESALLQRPVCLATHNANESINSLVWKVSKAQVAWIKENRNGCKCCCPSF